MVFFYSLFGFSMTPIFMISKILSLYRVQRYNFFLDRQNISCVFYEKYLFCEKKQDRWLKNHLSCQ